MSNPSAITLPETGIVEIVKEKLERARETLEHSLVEKDGGKRWGPIIDIVDSIEDCAIDNPDSITSAFFATYYGYITETVPHPYKKLLIEEIESNFIYSLNLAFLISISALSSKECLKNYTQYRSLAGGWKLSEFPFICYDNDGNSLELPAKTFMYDSVEQNLIFAMVYCLCVNHPSNVENSELNELLHYITESSEHIPRLTDSIFRLKTSQWYKTEHTSTPEDRQSNIITPPPPATTEEGGKTKRGRKKDSLFETETETETRAKEFKEYCSNFLTTKLDTTEDNPITKAIIIKLKEWFPFKYDPNGRAVYRFLHEDCGFECSLEGRDKAKQYGNRFKFFWFKNK